MTRIGARIRSGGQGRRSWRRTMAASRMARARPRRRWPMFDRSRARRWPVRRTRGRTMLDRPVVPVVALSIERAVAVIVVPVRADDKTDHRNADARAVVLDHDALILVLVLHIAAGDPATRAQRDHVTPFPAIGATLDIHPRPRRDRGDTRIVRVGTGAQIHVRRRETLRCLRQRGQGEGQ